MNTREEAKEASEKLEDIALEEEEVKAKKPAVEPTKKRGKHIPPPDHPWRFSKSNKKVKNG